MILLNKEKNMGPRSKGASQLVLLLLLLAGLPSLLTALQQDEFYWRYDPDVAEREDEETEAVAAAASEDGPSKRLEKRDTGTEEHITTEVPAAPAKQVPHACVYGIVTDCPENEKCVSRNNRSRSGICHCEEGYTRSNVTGICIKVDKPTTVIHVETPTTLLPNVSPASPTNQPVTTTTLYPLVVSAGENKVLHLPENEVSLSAYAIPELGNLSTYEWSLISSPGGDETGVMEDQNTKTLKLSRLRQGTYTIKVTVTGNHSYGEASVNVTVLPPKRINKPPVAIVQPDNVTIKLPNRDAVLDGSFSQDDDKIVKYHWEPVSVPIEYQIKPNETSTLQLKDLVPGTYRFLLTVTDSDGATNSTFANVTVLKEVDYPPSANAGEQQVIYLPRNEVILNGNLSTDDKGIKSWEWTKSPDTDKHVDMEGTTNPYLHLSNMEVGVYKFILKVTDTAGQTSTAEAHVIVKPESNKPPVANAGDDIKVTLPLQKPVILDGSKSTDDIAITAYLWTQVKGPEVKHIEDADKVQAKVGHLVPGEYIFQLEVFDDKNLTSTDNVTVSVTQKENMSPIANAGGDKTVLFPCDVVVINGSGSTDDVGIVSWEWKREAPSLAAGYVLENSDKTPVLKVANMFPGRYLFTLTVTDEQGATSKDTASLIVKAAPNIMDQVELLINVDIGTFTQEQEDTLLKQLELLLHESDPVHVKLVKLGYNEDSKRVRIIFYIEKELENKKQVLVKGKEVVSRLKRKLHTHSSLLDLEVLSVDTVVCQNDCSNHGSCDMYTKRCVCEAFWMEDFIRVYLGDQESNCGWSVLYVIIISFLILACISSMIWGITCFCSRMRFHRPKKRNRYTLLDINGVEKDSMEFLPKNKTQTNSLMVSDSDSDTLFETRTRSSDSKPLTSNNHNHRNANGLVKQKQKIKI